MEQINWKTNISITNDKIKQSLANYLLSKKFKETESEDGTYYLYHIDSQYFADFSYTISIKTRDIENSYSDILISFSYGEALNKFYYDEIVICGQYLYSNINRIDNIIIDKIGKVLDCIDILEERYKELAILYNLDSDIESHQPWKIRGSNGKNYTDLQLAIDEIYEVGGGEVWIAKGIYKHGAPMTMKNGVAIYGGFAGIETSKDQRVAGNETILDGEGKYRVFYNNYTESKPLTNSAKLDNVTIQNGYVNGNNLKDVIGAGMYNNYASPEITNCTFTGNYAKSSGGGMHNDSSSPVLTNCTFSNNSASYYGSGMYNDDSNPTLTNCTFTNNQASSRGSGMHNTSSSPTLTNCTFTNNSASSSGGGMYNTSSSSPVLTNCILWGNTALAGNEIHNVDSYSKPTIDTCIIQNGNSGISGSDYCTFTTEPITADPKLMPLGNYGGSVQTIAVASGSSAIGKGKVVDGLTTDARGFTRSSPPTIGAYEYID